MRFLAVGAVLLAGTCAGWLAVLRFGEGRRLRERLDELSARLDISLTSVSATTDVESALDRLAKSVEVVQEESREWRRLADWLAQTLEATPLGVVVTADDGRVVFRNRAAASLMGTRLEEALASQALSELLDSARSGLSTAKVLDLHGPPRRALTVWGVPMGEDGTAAVIIEDVSERKRLDAVRRDFVANVSHELKTPVGALGLLAETLASEDDVEVVHRLAERVQTEAFRVARIIEDLLNLSRLEAEEAPQHEPTPVQAVLAGAVEQIRPAASLRRVEIQVAHAPRDWAVVGDCRQLVSALFNLLENAVKYSDPGSTVEVRATSEGRFVDLVVRDHGIGIPSRDLDRIFERFYRVDQGRGRDTGGTGLGLSIVRHIAHNHQGEILVDSREGEGSTFILRVPAEPGPMSLLADAG
ncbi:MAG: ATP-binding protein [Actinomycetota bacterium]|nr:ATP-binding protein [Actinomycetota bacterium]MDQ3574956.1 ATP-binding protein [Actinomycetota bacterium]